MPFAAHGPRVLASWAIVATLALAGCGSDESADTSTAGPPSGLVTFDVGAESAPAELLLDGIVEAVNQATLSAQTAGRVAAAPVEVNDQVKRGSVLLQLRATEQVAGLDQAQAGLQAAQARDTQAGAQYDRIRDMYERKVVARATYDEALAARDAAAANLAAARATLQSAREGVAYTELRAPYDGVITAKRAQVGEVVAPGTPLVTVAALDAMRVMVEVPQSAAAPVQAAQSATVYVGDRSLTAAKVTLYPSAEPLSGTIRARVDLGPDARGLAPGTFAKVGFRTGQASRVLVPRSAVVERSELRAVYVVTPDAGVVLRQVRLGRATGDRIEVIAGLAKGEKVAVDPAAAGLAARAVPAARHE